MLIVYSPKTAQILYTGFIEVNALGTQEARKAAANLTDTIRRLTAAGTVFSVCGFHEYYLQPNQPAQV